MAGSDGIASIELLLDRSKFDADIRSLQSDKMKPLAVGLTFDPSGLNQQLKAIALKPLRVAIEIDGNQLNSQIQSLNLQPLELTLSTVALDRSFKQWRDRALGQSFQVPITFTADLTEVHRQLAALKASIGAIDGNQSIQLTAQVDDSQLTSLNKHLDLKKSHFAEVNRFFRSSPLTPNVDLSQLNKLEQKISSIKGKQVELKAKVFYDTSAKPPDIAQTVTRKVQVDTDDIEKKLGKSIESAFKSAKRGDLLGGLGSLASAPLKVASGLLSKIGGTITSGLITGITEPLGANLGSGLVQSLEKAAATSFGSTALIGKHLGTSLLEGVQSTFSGSKIASVVNDATKEISSSIQQSEDYFVETRAATAKQRQSQARKRKLAEPILEEELGAVAAKKPQILEAAARAEADRPGVVKDLKAFQEKEKATKARVNEQAKLIKVERSPDEIVEQRNQRKEQFEKQADELVKQKRFKEAIALKKTAATLPTLKAEDITPKDLEISNQLATTNAQQLFIAGSLAKLKPEREALARRIEAVRKDNDFAAKGLAELEKAGTGLETVQNASAADPKTKQRKKPTDQKNLPDAYRQIFDEVGQVQGVKNGKIPGLEVNASLPDGAQGAYIPALNQIKISPAIAKALQEGKLSLKQTETLVHEVEHAFQYGFGELEGQNKSAVNLLQPTFAESRKFGKHVERSTTAASKQLGVDDSPFNRKLEADAFTFADRNSPAIFEKVQRTQATSKLEGAVGVGGGKLELKLANAQKLALQKIAEVSKAAPVDLSNEIQSAIAASEAAAERIKPLLDKLHNLEILPVSEIESLQKELVAGANLAASEILGQVGKFKGAAEQKPDQVREQISGSLSQFNRKKTLVPLANEFGIENADQLKKSELIKQVTSQSDLRQLQPRVNELTRDRAQQQIARREKIEDVAQIAGRGARGIVGAGQAIAGSDQFKALAGIAGNTANGLTAASKTAYSLASGVEALALDMIPLGRAIKGVLQQTAIPAAAFGAATHFLPGGGAAAESLSHLVGGALNPLIQSGGSALAGSASEFVAGALPHALGIGATAANATSGLIAGATGAVGEIVINAATVILGGKVLTGAIENVGKSALKSALPDDSRALQPARIPLSLSSRELEPIEVERRQIPQAKTLALGDAAPTLKSEPFKEGAAKAGQAARTIIDAGHNVSEIVSGAISHAKDLDARFSTAYKSFKEALESGDSRLVAAYRETLNSIATRGKKEIDALIVDVKESGDKSGTVGTLGGVKGRITQRENLVTKSAEKFNQERSGERDITGLARVSGGEPAESVPKPGLFANLKAKFASLVPSQSKGAERLKQNYEAFYQEVASISGVAFDPASLPRLEINAAKLKQTGAQAFFDIEKNVIQIDDAIAQVLSRNAADLAKFKEQLDPLTHETRHSIQTDGGKLSIKEAAAGKAVNLLPEKDLSQQQKASVAGSVKVAQSQGAKGAQLQAIQKLEADAYGFEKNTSDVVAGVAAQFKNPSALGNIKSAIEGAIQKGVDAVAESLEGVQKAIPGLSRVSFEARLKTAAGKPSPLSTSDLENSDTGLAVPSARKRRIFNQRVASGNFTPPSLDKAPNLDALVDRGVDQAGKQALEAEYRRADEAAVQEIKEVKRRQQKQRQQVKGAIAAILKPEKFFQERADNAIVTDARSLLDNSEGIVGKIQTSIGQSPENKQRAKLDLDPIITPKQAKGIAQVDNGFGQLGAAAEAFQGDKSKKNLLELKAATKEVQAGLNALGVPSGLSPLTAGFEKLGVPISKLGGLLKTAALGFVGFQLANAAIPALKQFGEESLQAAIKAANLRTALDFSAGSSVGGAKSLEFVRGEVDRLGIPLDAAQKGFSQLSAATKGTSLAGQSTKDIFTGVASAATVLGLSSDDAAGAIEALTKISSKGKVSSEDLREELGTRIPGAFQLAARAVGVTEGELSKMLETGDVISSDFLPKFARELQSSFGGSAESASQNLQSSLFRVNNAFLRLQEISGAAIAPAASAGLQTLSGALNFTIQNGGKIVTVFATVATAVASAFLPAILSAGVALVRLGGGFAITLIEARLMASGLASTIPGAIGLAAKAFAPLLLQFAAVAIALEAGRSLFERFTPSSASKDMQSFADQAVESLKKIEEQGKKTQASLPHGLKSQGFDFAFGQKEGFKSDDFGNFINDRTASLPAPIRKFASNLVTLPFTHADRKTGKLETSAQVDFDRQKDAGTEFSGAVNKEVESSSRGEFFDPVSGKNLNLRSQLEQVAAKDKALAALQTQKNVISSAPKPDKDALRTIDKQILEGTQERETLSAPVAKYQSNLSIQKGNAKAGIATAEGLFNDGKIDKGRLAELTKGFEASGKNIDVIQTNVDKVTSSIQTSVTAAKDLNKVFLESAVRLETIAEKNTEAFKRNQIGDVKSRITNFASDQDASIKAPVVDASRSRDNSKAEFIANRTELENLRKEMDAPANVDLLKSIKVGRTGKSIDQNTSVAELDEAKGKLGLPADAEKKDIVERLIEFKKNRIKLTDLEKTAQETEIALIKAGETAKLAVIDKAFSQRASAIKRLDANTTIATISKRATNNVSDEDLGIEEAKSQKASVGRETQSANTKLSDLNQAKQQGLIGAEEYEKRVREIQDSLTDLAVKSAQSELAIVQAKNKKIIEGYERTYKIARAFITTDTASASINAKQSQLNGKIVGQGGSTQQNEIEIIAAQRKFDLISQQETSLAALRASGAINQKDFTDRDLALVEEGYSVKSQLVDLNTKKILTGIQSETDARKRSSDRAILDLNQQKSAQDLLSAKLDIRKGKLDTELKVSQALNESAQSALKISSDRSGENASAFDKLNEKGTGRNARAVLRSQLDSQGIDSGDKRRGAVTALQQQNNIESAIDNRKLTALQKQQGLELSSVRLGLEKEKVSARIAEIEARRAEISAKIAFNEAQGNLKKAEKTGDKNEIENAKSQVGLAGQNVELAGQGRAIAAGNVSAVDDRALGELTAKAASQQQAQNELGADIGKRRRGRELGIAEAADKAKLGGSQYSDVNTAPDFTDQSDPQETARSQFERFKKNMGGSAQAPSNSIVGTGRLPLGSASGDIVNLGDKISQVQSGNGAGVEAAIAKVSTFNNDVLSRLDRIADGISKATNKPSALYVSTPSPVSDSAKIFADFTKQSVSDLNL